MIGGALALLQALHGRSAALELCVWQLLLLVLLSRWLSPPLRLYNNNTRIGSAPSPTSPPTPPTTSPQHPQQHQQQKLKVTRSVFDAASGRAAPVSEVVEIGVKPGWKARTKVTFPGKGDERGPGRPPADLQFVVEELPHARFTRRGNDLHASVKVPLVDALCGGEAAVETLDGRRLAFALPQPFPGGRATKVLAGEGMPISKEPGRKGDLVVELDVALPALSDEQKRRVKELLPRTTA